MKKIYTLVLIGISLTFNAQETNPSTINFNGCHNLFDDTNYVFTSSVTLDNYGKKIYVTSPVDGDQACGGLGTCEFKIQWNETEKRWEFLADSGNGDFVEPYLIYYNSTGENSLINPPGNTIGEWVENTDLTNGECGGKLTPNNSNITGDIQETTLSVKDAVHNKMQLFPNPVIDKIKIAGIKNPKEVYIYSTSGQLVQKQNFENQINVSQLKSGMYFLKLTDSENKTYDFKFIKK